MIQTVSIPDATIWIDASNATRATEAAVVYWRRLLSAFIFSCRPCAPTDVHGLVMCANDILAGHPPTPLDAVRAPHRRAYTQEELLSFARQFHGADSPEYQHVRSFIVHLFA